MTLQSNNNGYQKKYGLSFPLLFIEKTTDGKNLDERYVHRGFSGTPDWNRTHPRPLPPFAQLREIGVSPPVPGVGTFHRRCHRQP